MENPDSAYWQGQYREKIQPFVDEILLPTLAEFEKEGVAEQWLKDMMKPSEESLQEFALTVLKKSTSPACNVLAQNTYLLHKVIFAVAIISGKRFLSAKTMQKHILTLIAMLDEVMFSQMLGETSIPDVFNETLNKIDKKKGDK